MAENDDLTGRGLIKTKYNKPGISHNLIPRQCIVEKLDHALTHKLTLVTAPAGYGKTAAVIEWLESRRLPSAWLSLDESENEPVRFWRYIMAAVVTGGFVQQSNVFEDIPLSKKHVLSNLFIELFLEKLRAIVGHLIIVLDGFHLIHDELVQKSLEHFIKNASSNIHIILLSRDELNPALALPFVKGQVLQLGSKDLSFNSDKINHFFKKRGFQLTSEDISCLEASTEGWVLGLVIAAFTMEDGIDIHEAVRGFSGSNRHISSFFRSEVFDRWQEEVKEFLVHTSFLDKLSQPLCDKVTGNANSNKLLRMLSESNSFIIPLEQENGWFRYHHLFQEFLMNLLEKESVTTQHSLYDKAGQWYLENGYISNAIDCFIKAKEFTKVFPLVWDIYLPMTQNGEYSTWRKWMDHMPEALCESDVRACTGYSWVLSMENRLNEAELWADKAQTCYDRMKDSLTNEEKEYLEAHIALTYANTAIFRRDAVGAVRHFKKVCEFNLHAPIFIGEMNSGEPNLLDTLYGFNGRLNKVEEAYCDTLEKLQGLLGDFSAYIAVTLAECHYEQNRLKDVYAVLKLNIGRIIGLNNPGIIVPCFITLAKEKRARGDIHGAFKIIESGRHLLTGKSKAFWSCFFDVFTASLYIGMGDTCRAEKWLATSRVGIFDILSMSRECEHIVYARYLILTNRYDDAQILLTRLDDFAQKEDRLRSRIEILCLTAISYHLQGNVKDSMLTLHKALELGSAEGYMRTFADEAQPIAALLIKYRTWGKQTGNLQYIDYANGLLKLTKAHIKTLARAPDADADAALNGEAARTPLSVRESMVLGLLADGLSNQEIANKLSITVRTVRHHNVQICKKMKAKNRLEAIIKARELSLDGFLPT
ncbi:MAG: LuxR C-terminal-related transcriptional regulator [Dehalobacter sp.]|nr:LuxR C-terminal-related transcriptional regulator [Dehalobacter sp.]